MIGKVCIQKCYPNKRYPTTRVTECVIDLGNVFSNQDILTIRFYPTFNKTIFNGITLSSVGSRCMIFFGCYNGRQYRILFYPTVINDDIK